MITLVESSVTILYGGYRGEYEISKIEKDVRNMYQRPGAPYRDLISVEGQDIRIDVLRNIPQSRDNDLMNRL